MPGFLYGIIIKEKLDELVSGIRLQLLQDVRREVAGCDFTDNRYITKSIQRVNAAIATQSKVRSFPFSSWCAADEREGAIA